MTVRQRSLIVIVGNVVVHGATGLAAAQHAGSDRNAKSAGVVTATWIGPATGGLWSDPANWDTAGFPNNGNGGLNYDVVIISPIFDPAVINLDTNVEIEALFLRGTLDAQSGPANLIVNGLFDLQGSLLGPGTTTANGSLIDPTINAVITIGGGRVLENAGMATFRTPLGITIIDGAQLNNLASGVINLQTFVLTKTGGELNNFGLLFTDTCCHNTQGVFNNRGLVEVRAGASLQIFSGGTHSGVFHVATGSALSFEAETGTVDFTVTSDITGPGDVSLGNSSGIGATTIKVAGGFSLTGTVTAIVPALNFANAPTSTGFTLDIPDSSSIPSVVSFESGLPALDGLTVATRSVLRIIGDANLSGPVRWDGTMSGAGTTTTVGPVRALRGLTLDGRTLIAGGGFLWQGNDFLLDNGAVFQNAEGSTWDIQLSRRIRLISTNTPLSPGRIVNSGIVSQTSSAPAHVLLDWQQTPTGLTSAEALSFSGNTDISGTVTVPAGFRNAITFAGPDTGATITHRLNPDSTLTVLGAVNVGDRNASGIDIINAEFAGSVDFSDSRAGLNIRGANTTATIVGTVVNNTINSVDVVGGTLVLVLPTPPPAPSAESSVRLGNTAASPPGVEIKRGVFGPGSTMRLRRGRHTTVCDTFFGGWRTSLWRPEPPALGIFDVVMSDFGEDGGTDVRFEGVCGTATGNVEIGGDSRNDLTNGARVQVDGATVFAGIGAMVTSSDGTGTAGANNANVQLAETTDPTTPSQTIDVPVVLTNSNLTASCPPCPGRPNVLFTEGLTLNGNCNFEHVDVTAQPGLTVSPNGEWTLNDAVVVAGMLDSQGAGSLSLKDSTLAIAVTPDSGLAIGADVLELDNAVVEFLDSDGTTSIGFLSGIISLEREVLDTLPQSRTLVIVINSFVSTGTVTAETLIAPGDTIDAPNGVGMATISADEIVVARGSVLKVDIDPTNPSGPNDVLQVVADTTTYDAGLEISLLPNSECNIGPADSFTIVTGTSITYPGGGDGRRILATGGEGSFLVKQGSTGVVLDGFLPGADGNGDGSVDAQDAAGFVPCMLGPDGGLDAGCDAFDFDFDGDGDLKDFSVLQKRFGTTCP